MIRSSEYCKRYEYVRFDLSTPIILPANDQFQQKSGYKFYVDTTSEVSPMDIYNSFLEINFNVTRKSNDAAIGAAEAVATINGSCALISQLKCDYNGIVVIDTPYVNHAINLKNMVEFSQEYSDKVGPSMFWYPDTNVGAVTKKYTTKKFTPTTGTEMDVEVEDFGDYNHGFAQRVKLFKNKDEVNTLYPLNRFGFIEAFQDKILPNGKLVFDFTLETDNNVIFRTSANESRYVITKMVLWIPKMILNVMGEKVLVERYIRNQSWSYLRERIEVSPNLQVRQGMFRITPAIQNPKHLFIWFLNAEKLNSQEQNMFNYNTYTIDNNANGTITDCQVEVNSGNYYPQVRLNSAAEKGRAYRMLIEYTKLYNDRYNAPLIDLDNFQKLFGILYFDLSGQQDNTRDEIGKRKIGVKVYTKPSPWQRVSYLRPNLIRANYKH